MSIDQRTLDLQQIANDIERLTNRYASKPVAIAFEKMTTAARTDFTDWQLQKFGLFPGSEYFLINQGPTLLYAVDVTMDSI